MKKLLTKAAFALLALMLPQLAVSVSACSCMPLPPPYEAFKEAKVVFAGKVISSNVPPYEQLHDKGYTAIESVFRFAVEESFKGVKTAEVEISAGNTGTSCYWGGFTVGESYLIYGYDYSGSALTSGSLPFAGACTRTNGLAWAQDDLHYLRSMLKGALEPRVYGSLTRIDNDLSKPKSSLATPLEGIKIIVEGEKRRFEAVTDKQGLFSLAKVPDGKYKARPVLPDKYTLYFPGEAEFILGNSDEPEYPGRIRQGESAYARFRIGWKNEISGKVLDAEGNPVRRAEAALFSVRSPSGSPLLVEKGIFNLAEGKYRFYGQTPGRYLPSVTIEAPFKSGDRRVTVYYPSALNPGQASDLEIKESETLSDRHIKLPPPYLVRQVEGVIVWPDGRPAIKGWAVLAAKESLAEGEKGFDWGSADEQGRFSLQGFVGAEYWLLASVNTYGMKTADGKDLWGSGVQELKAQPVKVTVGKTNGPLRIVIPLPEGVKVDEKR